jgi:two-component system nitrogen regulation response regulator GlnG
VARAAAEPDARLLLLGESGTGKELVARGVHELSERKRAPWVAVNIAALPRELIESALFGHEKGSFTGAHDRRIGYLEEAGTGTLFLDEIGDLEKSLQSKLLRAIQEKEFRRIGGKETLSFRARLICATHRDLPEEVRKETFRRDLYHRIAEVTVLLPPLRDRGDDLDILVRHFLDKYGRRPTPRLSRDAWKIIRSYTFPGNIRELENMIKAAGIASDGKEISPSHLPLREMGALSPAPDRAASGEGAGEWPEAWLKLPLHQAHEELQRAFDRRYLPNLLDTASHNITRAAAKAGIDPKTFRRRWEECGLPSLQSRKDEADA